MSGLPPDLQALAVRIFGEEPAVPVFNYHDVSEMIPLDSIDDLSLIHI